MAKNVPGEADVGHPHDVDDPVSMVLEHALFKSLLHPLRRGFIEAPDLDNV